MATLAAAVPYRQFIKEGVADLRDDGILKGYWLIGPSPDSCDEANLLARAEQLGKSPVHFRTGDAIQVVFDRQPAPLPPDLHTRSLQLHSFWPRSASGSQLKNIGLPRPGSTSLTNSRSPSRIRYERSCSAATARNV